MPTYEYSCKSCGEHLEVVQSFTDDPLTQCPACGGVLRKVFGNIGITFKGSGFYKNDSRPSSKSGSSSSTDGSSSSSSSSDSPSKSSDSPSSSSPAPSGGSTPSTSSSSAAAS